MVTTHKATSNEQTSHTMPENHIDTTTMLMEMTCYLEDLKMKNAKEVEKLRQENSKTEKEVR